MGLRDILRKKDDAGNDEPGSGSGAQDLSPPEFKIVRTDTHTSEVVPPSQYQNSHRNYLAAADSNRSRSVSLSSQASAASTRSRRRLSERLGLNRAPASSEHVPQNLPNISPSGDKEREHEWEHRATMLASATDAARSRPATPPGADGGRTSMGGGRPGVGGGLGGSGGGLMPAPASGRSRSASAPGPVSSQQIDVDIQEAIRLHEEGNLEKSTVMFGVLADPQGANNPLSQVLFGLALRHGWGCQPNVTEGVKYLTAAASNAGAVEELALQAGLKKGGAAKGELVLAIFELGNSFRHGWGTEKDPIAAKQYYETAANLGDTDAMNETAWCYLEGFGCKKDKFASARYYRMAEKNGHPTMGNSWIWKEKYNPPEPGGVEKKKKLFG